MKEDSKKLAALIVSGPPKDPEAGADNGMDEVEGEDEGLDEGKMAAAEEAMSAMRAGDARGFAEAMRSFIRMCDY